MKPLSGNVSDPGSFPELIERHVDHLQNAHGFDYVVADSSLYSADHVEKLTEGGVKFVTRVPETISGAKTRIQEAEIESMGSLTEGYRGEEYRSEWRRGAAVARRVLARRVFGRGRGPSPR